jgi:TRF2-interacting telomeric protein/Rap1/ARID/BRIGHT DNA binding protein
VPEDEEGPGEEADDAERANFFTNLKIFMEAQGKRNTNVDFEPTVERQVVDLYQLYTIVDELDTDIDPSEFTTRDWAEIATLMGLDCSNGEGVAKKTGKIWDVYLQEFYKSLEPDEEEEDDQEQEDPTPRPLLGQKRSLEPDPELPSKRRHRSRDEEIAATPVSNARRGEKPMTSPSLAAGAPTPSLPSRHRPTNEGDEDNITPSQQLHDEEAEVTPIPIQLDGSSSRRRSNGPGPESPIAWREVSEPPVQDDGVAELASQVERFQALGYSAADVKTALRATTLDIGLAGYVMEHYLRQKKKLPANMEGVWTKRDDDGLRFVDGLPSRMGAGAGEDEDAIRRRRKTEWARLVEKHTQDRIETRREYLELAGEVARR